MPSRTVSSRSVLTRAPSASATPRMRPNTISIVAVSHRLRATVSIWSWKSSPSTAIGMVPMMTSQPIRASGSCRASASTMLRLHALRIAAISRRK